MPSKISKQVQPSPAEEIEAEVSDLEEEIIEKPVRKPKSQPMDVAQEPVSKPKKPRTPAQQAQFQKALEVKRANALRRKTEREQQEAEAKEALQDLIVKKAIKIKQKQIRKVKVLEEISDDSEEEEESTPPPRPSKQPAPIKTIAKTAPKAQPQSLEVAQARYRFL
jgi:hypothetical protein